MTMLIHFFCLTSHAKAMKHVLITLLQASLPSLILIYQKCHIRMAIHTHPRIELSQ